MPAKSEAQRRLLASRFGPTWMHKHGFDNAGKLPEHVSKEPRTSTRHRAVTAMLKAGHGR